MNSSGSTKVLAAFALGVALTLGGALLYVKSSNKAPSQPVASAAPAAAQQSTPAELPDADHGPAAALAPEPTAAPAPPAHKTHSELSSLGHKYTHNKANTEPELISQSQPPAPPQPLAPAAPPNPYVQTAPPAAPPTNQAPAPPQRPAVQEPTSRPDAIPEKRVPQTVTLDAGTSIVIRLTQAISTDHSNSGDTFRGTLQLPIIRNGFVIAEKGAFVAGKIVTSQTPGKVKGGGDLSVQLTEINTSDGQRVPVQTSIYDRQGSGSEKGSAAKVGGGAALGAIIGAIAGGGKGAAIGAGAGGGAGAGAVLLGHHKEITLPSETELTFRLSEPVTITERLN